MYSSNEVIEQMANLGVIKVNKDFKAKAILGFMGGALVAMGYLAYIIILGSVGAPYGHLIGAMIFPFGLIVILMMGGELITGNMTVVAMAYWQKKVSLKELLNNWLFITIANVVGAISIALVLGVYLKMLDPYVDVVNRLAIGKASYDAGRIFVSGIACNWVVGIAIWLFMAMKGGFDKLMGAWFPTMVFVVLAFQHSVANAFLFAASIFYGGVTLTQALSNFFFSYSGNVVGGAVIVALLYSHVGGKKQKQNNISA